MRNNKSLGHLMLTEWHPTPVLLLGKSHGLYSSWGHKELDTTEQLSLSHIRDCCMTVVYSDFSTVGNFVLRGQRQHLEIFFYCSTWSVLKAEVPGKRWLKL